MDEGLEDLYAWVDTVPLTRPKKAFNRDFADGVLVAEIVHFFCPRLVQLHNYSPANGLAGKQYNWYTLNQRVFRSLGLSFTKQQLSDAASAIPGSAESILKVLRARLQDEVGPQAERTEGKGVEEEPCVDVIPAVRSGEASPPPASVEGDLVAHLQQTIELLGVKISKMEQLLQLKDAKIQALTEKLQTQQAMHSY
ncbi:hypothetical protein ACKKBF_B01715 [Auxenochlorella protothecoides x Auxenochlorella symbiontica]